MKTITKTFDIETSPAVMRRIERFLALLHYNSIYGHSGTFAMPLDGDGCDKVTVTPAPDHAQEVGLISGVGFDVEIAYDDSYSGRFTRSGKKNDYIVSTKITKTASLYKNGEIVKTVGA